MRGCGVAQCVVFTGRLRSGVVSVAALGRRAGVRRERWLHDPPVAEAARRRATSSSSSREQRPWTRSTLVHDRQLAFMDDKQVTSVSGAGAGPAAGDSAVHRRGGVSLDRTPTRGTCGQGRPEFGRFATFTSASSTSSLGAHGRAAMRPSGHCSRDQATSKRPPARTLQRGRGLDRQGLAF